MTHSGGGRGPRGAHVLAAAAAHDRHPPHRGHARLQLLRGQAELLPDVAQRVCKSVSDACYVLDAL
jgi:hypothetical protein